MQAPFEAVSTNDRCIQRDPHYDDRGHDRERGRVLGSRAAEKVVLETSHYLRESHCDSGSRKKKM